MVFFMVALLTLEQLYNWSSGKKQPWYKNSYLCNGISCNGKTGPLSWNKPSFPPACYIGVLSNRGNSHIPGHAQPTGMKSYREKCMPDCLEHFLVILFWTNDKIDVLTPLVFWIYVYGVQIQMIYSLCAKINKLITFIVPFNCQDSILHVVVILRQAFASEPQFYESVIILIYFLIIY